MVEKNEFTQSAHSPEKRKSQQQEENLFSKDIAPGNDRYYATSFQGWQVDFTFVVFSLG